VMFIGDDWAEDHHDVEIEGDDGRRLARARCPRAWRASAGCTRWWLNMRRRSGRS
jgi:hypothetical protein